MTADPDVTVDDFILEEYDPPLTLPEGQALPPRAPPLTTAARHRAEHVAENAKSRVESTGKARRRWPARGSLASVGGFGALGLGLVLIGAKLLRR